MGVKHRQHSDIGEPGRLIGAGRDESAVVGGEAQAANGPSVFGE